MQTLKGKIQATATNVKQTVVNIVLITNAFVWYYFVIEILKVIADPDKIGQAAVTWVWLLHFSCIGLSALIGAALAKKVKNRSKFIVFWMVSGVILSGIAVFIDLTYLPNILIMSSLLGISLGFGMPSCMGYFSETIPTDKRGRIAGITFLISGLLLTGLGFVSGENIPLQTTILFGWRSMGLFIFAIFLLTLPIVKEKSTSLENMPKYGKLITQKSFLLYLIPWTLFSLITYLSIPVQASIVGSLPNMPTVGLLRGIENILLSVSAVVCGFLSDIIGRKRMAIVGFSLLGLGYSFVGIQFDNPLSWYLYTVFDGIALGILYAIFVIAIWSDLSHGMPSEKYYAVGVLPFFISYLLRLTTAPELTNSISGNAIFPFIAVFLFIAVLPLVYAPETLPDKVMKDRDLKSYVEKAKQKAQKEAQKKRRQPAEEKPSEFPEEKTSSEYEKAKALAEKYY